MSEELDKLDRLAAEHVMGFTQSGCYWYDKPGSIAYDVDYQRRDGSGDFEVWQPTREISQAWECLMKFVPGQFEVRIALDLSKWVTAIRDVTFAPPHGIYEGRAETAPLAITKAALKAKGVNID